MTLRQRIALLTLIAVPQSAWASGGDVLSLAWLEAGLLALVLGSLLVFRLSVLRSLGVFGVYLLAASGSLYVTREWPYLANRATVNALCVGLPFLAWLFAIVCLRRKKT